MKLYELMAQVTKILHNLTPEQAREVLEAEVRTGTAGAPDLPVRDHVCIETGIFVMYQRSGSYDDGPLYPERDWACEEERCQGADLQKVVYLW